MCQRPPDLSAEKTGAVAADDTAALADLLEQFRTRLLYILRGRISTLLGSRFDAEDVLRDVFRNRLGVPKTQYAVKVGDFQRVRIPPGPSVARPEATRATKEATNSLKYSGKGHLG